VRFSPCVALTFSDVGNNADEGHNVKYGSRFKVDLKQNLVDLRNKNVPTLRKVIYGNSTRKTM
jgi:hypothetical protein